MPRNNNGSRTTRRRAPRSSRVSRPISPPSGNTIVRYREQLSPVLGEKTRIHLFCPGVSGLPHLDARAAMYEMYRIRGPVRVEYKTAAATTTAGEIVLGIDFDPKDFNLSYAATAALSPKTVSPVWRNTHLLVPVNTAMKQKWYTTATHLDIPTTITASEQAILNWPYDTVAFGIQVTSTANQNTGSLWVEYDIELASPKLLDVRTGISIVPYLDGKATGAATDVFNHGAATCPVAQGEFWVGMTDGKRHPDPLRFGQGDVTEGYFVDASYTADTLPMREGFQFNGLWDLGTFARITRDENAGALWGAGTGANPQWPNWNSTHDGNLLYIVAPTLAALWLSLIHI